MQTLFLGFHSPRRLRPRVLQTPRPAQRRWRCGLAGGDDLIFFFPPCFRILCLVHCPFVQHTFYLFSWPEKKLRKHNKGQHLCTPPRPTTTMQTPRSNKPHPPDTTCPPSTQHYACERQGDVMHNSRACVTKHFSLVKVHPLRHSFFTSSFFLFIFTHERKV